MGKRNPKIWQQTSWWVSNYLKKIRKANISSFSHSKERRRTQTKISLSVYNSLYDWPKNKEEFQPPTIVMRRDLAFAVQAIFNNPSCPVIPCLGEWEKKKKRRRERQRSYDKKYLNDAKLHAGGNTISRMLIFYCFLKSFQIFFFFFGAGNKF